MFDTIRKAEEADAERIAELEKVCFSDPWSAESIKNAILNCTVAICAEEAGEIAGYGFTYVVADESEVLNVAVAPVKRGRGIGRALMEEMLSRAKELGAATVYLEVRESNEAAKALYSSLGFVRLGSRKNYYRYPTEDALLMAKILNDNGGANDNTCD